MNLHRHPSPHTIFFRGCWLCRLSDCVDRIDYAAERFVERIRSLVTGGRQ